MKIIFINHWKKHPGRPRQLHFFDTDTVIYRSDETKEIIYIFRIVFLNIGFAITKKTL